MGPQRHKELGIRFMRIVNKIHRFQGQASYPLPDGSTAYPAEIAMLCAICDHPGASAGELAEHMGITRGAVSQTTRRLGERGLIEKYANPEDRRESLFRATESGAGLYKVHQREHDQKAAALMSWLDEASPDQLEFLLRFFKEAEDHIDELHRHTGMQEDE